MNQVIAITGPSGVGKSTISKIITICLGYKNSIVISGDDSHLWERGDENWKFFTHLNPSANNLKTEYNQILDLKNGKKISRSHYDHTTGKFIDPLIISPKENIVYEGLHSMYGPLSDLADISFFIEVEKSLKNEWKISRDSRKRGYSIEQIIKSIENRKQDENNFIEPQKNKCDVILKFKRSNNGKIKLSFDYNDPSLTWLINKIKKLYSLLEEFVYVSNKIAEKMYLAQNKGGNLSFKFDDVIIITESGSSFENINYFEGFGFYTIDGENIFKNQKRPSMEIDCHLQLGLCCLHTHPLHILAILCSKECESIIDALGIEAKVIDYFSPGKSIANNMVKHKNVFLKNHGIFISRESLVECLESSIQLDTICKEYLQKKIKHRKFLFPDAFVLEEENRLYHSYIKDLINICGLTPKPLLDKEIEILENMEEEKYRRSLK